MNIRTAFPVPFQRDNLFKSIIPICIAMFSTLLLGAIFFTTIGPLSLPDPDMHAREIYALATGQGFQESETYTDPSNNTCTAQYMTLDSRVAQAPMNNSLLAGLILLPNSGDSTREAQREALSGPENGSTEHVFRRSQYFPLAYAPQAIAVAIVSAAGGTPWAAFQAARLFNLFLTLLLEVAAIILIPRGKMILAIIASFPTTVFLAASISIDATVPALVMLFMALIALSLSRQSMGNAAIVACSIICALLFFSKIAYVVFILLLFVLPERILPRRKKIAALLATCVVILPAHLLWKSVVSFQYAPLYNCDANISWIKQHPVALLLKFAVTFGNIPYFFAGMPLRCTVSIFTLAITVLFCMRDYSFDKVPQIRSFISRWRLPLTGMLCCLIIIGGVYCMLAITWNDLPASVWSIPLEGIQERYYLPLLASLVLLLYPVENAISEPIEASKPEPERNSSEETK